MTITSGELCEQRKSTRFYGAKIQEMNFVNMSPHVIRMFRNIFSTWTIFGCEQQVRADFPAAPRSSRSRVMTAVERGREPRNSRVDADPWRGGVEQRWQNVNRAGKVSELLKGIHQARDGAVQVFVGAAHLFDFVDRVQYRGVVLAAELAANFGKRCGSELLNDVHGHLPRKGDRSRIAANFQISCANHRPTPP